MKIWDVFPAYLGRTLLLVEHRELHALAALRGTEQSFAADIDMQTVDWYEHPWALAKRHRMVVEEMRLLRLEHNSPLAEPEQHSDWPPLHRNIGIPTQFEQLRRLNGDSRIPVVNDVSRLWQQVAYSVMARDDEAYRYLAEAAHHGRVSLSELQAEITELLRQPAQFALWSKTINVMWQDCQSAPEVALYQARTERPYRRLKAIQFLAGRHPWLNLWHSTAISDLMCCAVVSV